MWGKPALAMGAFVFAPLRVREGHSKDSRTRAGGELLRRAVCAPRPAVSRARRVCCCAENDGSSSAAKAERAERSSGRAKSEVSDASTKKRPKLSRGLRLLEKGAAFGALVRVARFGWHRAWLIMMAELAPTTESGDYSRPASQFRISESALKAARASRAAKDGPLYKLYAGKSCPWCHRVLLARAVLELEDVVEVVELEPSDTGVWRLAGDPERRTMKDVYAAYTAKSYSGRCTAPLLVQCRESSSGAIVSNESADIVRLLDAARGAGRTASERSLYAVDGIDAQLQAIYERVNNGVYAAGFARSQDAYERAARGLFATLDDIESRLARSAGGFVLGDALSAADIYLFPTVFRLDAVYGPLFKCTLKSVRADYPNISRWLRRMHGVAAGVSDTCDLDATRHQYFTSLFPLNPSGIVPLTP
mmetsp:Transcript_6692/g.17979  ORF Transcript_6692/g.17979 Transcript_6692/m.17979 type:complete len:421 (-) Transcript_6692:8-1270(-)